MPYRNKEDARRAYKARSEGQKDHCHASGDVNRGILCTQCNMHEGAYSRGRFGPMATLPHHIENYIADFGQGWHTNPDAIEALRATFADLDARGL